MTTPKILEVNSIEIICPRDEWSATSVACNCQHSTALPARNSHIYPDRNHRVENTGANAIDNSCDNHPVDILRRTLQCGPEDRPKRANRNSLNPAVLVASPTTEKAPKQGSEIVNGDDSAYAENSASDREKGLTQGKHNTPSSRPLVTCGSLFSSTYPYPISLT